MKYFKETSRYWPALMPRQSIAISWLKRNIATKTLGAYIYWMPRRKGLTPTIPSLMPVLDCGPGSRAALGDTPCHGDVFHIEHQCETLANLLGRLAQGAATRRQRLEQRMTQARLNPSSSLVLTITC